MGINGLWEVLGDGDVRHIADYAAEHFQKTGKPLRIAVDEACWRFTNLTPEQVEKIREGEPAANPVEKVILWRILRLWRLNIQLLFVWDGLRKPGKKRGGGGKVDRKCVELLHRMFEILQVPYHQAPGEAEAECARLEKAGIVDAVWSDDGDCFMFGCQTLIKQHKVSGKRITDHVRIYRADTIAREMDFDVNSFILFAVLTGHDYEKAGLPGCGPQTAKVVAKRPKGIAQALAEASPRDMPAWRRSLGDAIRKGDIPSTFPNMKALKNFCEPAVSSEEKCHSIHRLRNGFDIKFDQAKARIELRDRYNFTTREYLKHLAPVFLVRRLARLTFESQREENKSYDVKLKPSRVTKATEGAPAKSEAKIMFAAPLLVDIDVTTKPSEEDWSKFAAKDGTPYDPTQNIEGEVLRCFLEHGLPPGSYEAPVKPKKSRAKDKKAAEDDEQRLDDGTDAIVGESNSQSTSNSKKRKRTANSRADATQDAEVDQASSQKQARTSEDTSGRPKAKRKSKAAKTVERTPSPPPTTFKIPKTLNIGADVVDLCEGDSDVEQSEGGLFMSPASAPPSVAKTRPVQVPSYRPLPRLSLSQEDKKTQSARKSSSKASSSPQQAKTKATAKTASKPAQSRTASAKTTTLPKSDAPADKPMSMPTSTSPALVKASNHQAYNPPSNEHLSQISPALADSLIPGEAITPATLRELRAAAFSRNMETSQSEAAPARIKPLSPAVPKPPMVREVIDLT